VRWSASVNASGTGKGHEPAERNPACGDVSRRWEWRPPVNRDVLIGAGHWLYIQPVPQGRGHECCSGLTTICSI